MKVQTRSVAFDYYCPHKTQDLLDAIYERDVDTTRELLKEGVRFPNNADESTIHSYRVGVLEMVNQLRAAPAVFFIQRVLKQGFDVNTPVDGGFIALREAFFRCHSRPAVLTKILEATDPEALRIKQDAMSTHLLHTFCANATGERSTLTFLTALLQKIPKGIPVEEWKDFNGFLPVTYASDRNVRKQIYRYLENYYSDDLQQEEMRQVLLRSYETAYSNTESEVEFNYSRPLFPRRKRSSCAPETKVYHSQTRLLVSQLRA